MVGGRGSKQAHAAKTALKIQQGNPQGVFVSIGGRWDVDMTLFRTRNNIGKTETCGNFNDHGKNIGNFFSVDASVWQLAKHIGVLIMNRETHQKAGGRRGLDVEPVGFCRKTPRKAEVRVLINTDRDHDGPQATKVVELWM